MMDIEDQKSESITEVKFVEIRDPVKKFLTVSTSESKSEPNSERISNAVNTENVDLVFETPPRFFRSSFIHKTKELFSKNHTTDDAFESDSKQPLKAKSVKFRDCFVGRKLFFFINSQFNLDYCDGHWILDGVHCRLLVMDSISERSNNHEYRPE